MLVFGTLMYNEILIIPFFGLDANTKEKLEARAAKEKRDANYMATSPGAPYDASRNKRLLQAQDDKHYNQVHDDDDNDFNMNATADANSNAK